MGTYLPNIRINWSEYFREFSRQHGGDPVVYRRDKDTGLGGYFLFRTGWMYSRSSTAGPEYPPKSVEERRKKCRDYWLIRRAILRQAVTELEDNITSLANEQELRSAPLMTTEIAKVEDDDGKLVVSNQPVRVDFAVMLDRLNELSQLVHECNQKLKTIDEVGEFEESSSPAVGTYGLVSHGVSLIAKRRAEENGVAKK